MGGAVFKQRLARQGQGKSGGYRCIIFYRIKEKVFFVHGFLKADEDNISNEEERDFKKLAAIFLELSQEKLIELVKLKELVEVKCNDKSENL